MTDPTEPQRPRKPILVPGHVASQTDRDWHYIGVAQLCRLYGLRTDQVIVEDGSGRSRGVDYTDRVVLEPRSDGSYYNFIERYGVPR
jgi:hypothetical protein